MADTDSLLRWLFIRLNIVYMIFAGVVFLVAIGLDVYLRNTFADGAYQYIAWIQTPVWLLGFGILLVASIGIYGAKEQKRWPFVSYITASTIGVIMMVSNGAQLAQLKYLLTLGRKHGTMAAWQNEYHDNNITIFNIFIFGQLFLAAFEIPGLVLAVMNVFRLK